MPARSFFFFASILLVPGLAGGALAGTPETWIPAQWSGGPLEVARRATDKALADPAIKEALAQWYNPSTLGLLEGTPVNCLLVSFSAGAAPDVERQQHDVIKEYAAAARQKGVAVLGLVYPGADPSAVAAAAADAHLDGVVLEGQFPPDFAANMEKALAAAKAAALVIPIAQKPAPIRLSKAPVLAVEGVAPASRNLADMGIRGTVSTEPWIESNAWLVRSFRLTSEWRPIWISGLPDGNTTDDYVTSVADAAVAGGRWIVTLDDQLQAKLFHKDDAALATWRSIGATLKFAEDHADWRAYEPYANVAIILDTGSADPDNSDEYLHLATRRQIPYRLVLRSQLTAESLAGMRAVIAPDLAPPTAAERKLLTDFATQGGVVIMGHTWDAATNTVPWTEEPLGKGKVIIYHDNLPAPDSVAHDLKDLVPAQNIGVSLYNVPSMITYASKADSGKRVLVQLLNYSIYPAVPSTVRVTGDFKSARYFTQEGPPADLTVRKAGDRTEISIPKLVRWGIVLFE
jgi:hypothetical protein